MRLDLLDAAQGALIDLEERVENDYAVNVINKHPKALEYYERDKRGLMPLRDAIQREREQK